MKYLVLGGRGDIGSQIVKDLFDFTEGTIGVAGRDYEATKSFCEHFGPRVKAELVSVDDHGALVTLMKNYDVTVSAVGPAYTYAQKIIAAAIDAGSSLVDVSDDHQIVNELEAIKETALKAGVTIICGMGHSPGMANVFASESVGHFESIDKINIYYASGANDAEGFASTLHYFNVMKGMVPTFENGAEKFVEASSESESVVFPAPIGRVTVRHAGYPVTMTIPKHIKVTTVACKCGLTPNWNNHLVKLLIKLGACDTEARTQRLARVLNKAGKFVAAGGKTTSSLRVDIVGTKDGHRKTRIYTVTDRLKRLTGVPAAVVTKMLAKDRSKFKAGLYWPEEGVPTDLFLSELKNHGIKVEIQEDFTKTDR